MTRESRQMQEIAVLKLPWRREEERKMFFMLDHQPGGSKIRISSSHFMIFYLRKNNTCYSWCLPDVRIEWPEQRRFFKCSLVEDKTQYFQRWIIRLQKDLEKQKSHYTLVRNAKYKQDAKQPESTCLKEMWEVFI